MTDVWISLMNAAASMSTGNEKHVDILPMAFHILWQAAQLERQHNIHQKRNVREDFLHCKSRSVDATYEQVMRQKLEKCTSVDKTYEAFLAEKVAADLNIPNKNAEFKLGKVALNATSAVVVLDCEDGEKLVKKVFSGGKDQYGVSSTEDMLMDWLSSELSCQHSEKVDVTFYLSCPPQSTTTDGILLWWRNLTEEGKRVALKIKLASLGCLSSWYDSHNSGLKSQLVDAEEKTEMIQGMQKLRDNGAVVKPISPREWPTILSLLTDRASISALESSYNIAHTQLENLLQTNSKK